MTRTKCEIEQPGGNKSGLTTRSDQRVAAASGGPASACPGAVRTKWGIFSSLQLHLMLPSDVNSFRVVLVGEPRSLLLLLLSLLVGDIEGYIIEGKAKHALEGLRMTQRKTALSVSIYVCVCVSVVWVSSKLLTTINTM